MEDQIRENLVYLCANISNLMEILLHLRQKRIISMDESDQISTQLRPLAQNDFLLRILEKKDWNRVGNAFLEILRKTSNEHCADKIQGKSISLTPEVPDNGILNNFVYLRKNIGNLHDILIRLLEDGTISVNEKEQIESKNTSWEKNDKLLTLIQEKMVRDQFLEILRETNNAHCAEEIEKAKDSGTRKCEKIGKWWPDKKSLIKALHKRKCGDKLLVEELHDRITTDEKRMVVICESADAGKYSGMGGIGKTLTAKWYAHTHEEFYGHILWVDCGEDSLLKSFKKLANDLDVPNRRDFEDDVEELARKCFQVLSDFTCLWIYDNAENYKGKDGIIKVLPQFQKEFYCLITSRSREWGMETGYGKISKLPLEIFSEAESLEFLETNLKNKNKCTEYELKELCKLLSNLPLALQLAVAALNESQMDVKTYIEKSKIVKVLDAEFDDYEKTINGNVKVSLDLIEKEENGTTAKEILMIFGYIRPDDIQLQFFESVQQIQEEKKIKESLKFLKRYSLVSKTKIIKADEQTEILFSIHRLLQQVIRHNGKDKEKENLRKILRCDGFIEYKLLPFTKYADEELRKEFPKVKAQLLDQQQLRKLMKEKRFEESVQLAKFIDLELKRKSTMFNYAICLHENGQLEECFKTAEELLQMIPLTGNANSYSKVLGKMFEYLKAINLRVHVNINYHLMDVEEENKGKLREEIMDFVIFSYLRLGKFNEAIFVIGRRTPKGDQILTILTEVMKQKKLNECVELANIIHQEINTKRTKLNYAICLQKSGQLEECAEIAEQMFVKRNINGDDELATCVEELFKCAHRMTVLTPQEYDYPRLVDLAKEAREVDVGTVLLYSHLRLGNHQAALPIAKQIVTDPWQLIGILTLTQVPNYHLQVANYSNTIDLKLDVETKKIYLRLCFLSLNCFDRLSPEELTLDRVSFLRDEQELNQVKVNDFLDLLHIKRLTLCCDEDKKNLSLDLSGDVCMESLQLNHVKLLNWNQCSWNLKKLELWDVPFVETTNMNVQELTFRDSSLDVSCLPQTTQRIHLKCDTKVFASGEVELSNLNYLTLERMEDVGCLSHFHSAPITHIHLHLIKKEVKVDLLPRTLFSLKITKVDYNPRVVGGVRKVDKLILDYFYFEGVEKCLSRLQTDNLVISSYRHPLRMKSLLLLSKKINRIAVGEIDWGKEEFKNYTSQLDRQADFYLLQGGMGRGMDKKEFEELMKPF